MRTRIDNIAVPNGVGPDAYHMDLRLGGAGRYELESWISNFGGCNVHLFEGELNLEECQERLAKAGKKEMITTVTGAGPTCVPYEADTQKITVYFEGVNESGQTQVVTVQLKEYL